MSANVLHDHHHGYIFVVGTKRYVYDIEVSAIGFIIQSQERNKIPHPFHTR